MKNFRYLGTMLTFVLALGLQDYAQTFSGGNGSQNYPYIITTAAQLDLVRDRMMTYAHYRLGNDIDLTDYLAIGGAGYAKWQEKGWEPIGDGFRNYFYGSFNGAGHKITGLWMYRPTGENVGLFGAAYGNIDNLELEVSIRGFNNVGGLVGTNGAVISNCYVTGDVTGGDGGIGGLAGLNNDGNISNCYAAVNVEGVEDYTFAHSAAGGLVGINLSTISNCYTTGDVIGIGPNAKVGGLVAENHLTIKNCIAANNNIAMNLSSNINRIAVTNSGTLINNYANSGMVIRVNGVVVSRSDGTDITLEELKYFDFYNSTMGWDIYFVSNPAKAWKICDGNGLPFLQWQPGLCFFAIEVQAGNNGSITPSSTINNITEGEDIIFTITPDPCYEIEGVWIDGTLTEIGGDTYTFENMDNNHTIAVSFKLQNVDTARIPVSICEGGNYEFLEQILTKDSIYYFTVPTANGCGSVIELTLSYYPPVDTTQISAFIYEGDSYLFFGRSLTTSNVYYHTLQSVNGCDSVIELNLTVTPILSTIGISGTVLCYDLRPLSAGLIELQKLNKNGTAYNKVATISVKSDGTYLFANVENGTYIVLAKATNQKNDGAHTFYVNASQWKNAVPITVNGVSVQNINFVLLPHSSVKNSKSDGDDEVGVAELATSNEQLKIYPNPTNGQLKIKNYELKENEAIEIYNVVGQKAPFNSPEGGKLPSFGGVGGGSIVIDVSHLSNGMYFLKVGNKTVRFVKE